MQGKPVFFPVVLSVLVSASVAALVASSFSHPKDESTSQLNEEIQYLKTALAEQKALSLALEQRLSLKQPPVAPSQTPVSTLVEADSEEQEEAYEEPTREERIREFRERVAQRQVTDFKRQSLLEYGFAEDETNWILQQEAQVQLDTLQEQYRARRARVELDKSNGTQVRSQFDQLREKLGDNYYERYLEANGLPTSINVRSVLERSPASNAGLKAGDQILSYDGKRVFNIRDLNGLTVLGQEGQSVLIEVERDGSPVQITLPRGPIGITGGANRF